MKSDDNPTYAKGGQVEKAAASISLAKLQPEQARGHFRALLVANPNYFGNVKDSAFKPVFNIQCDTTYEEIGCVGFQPQVNRLEAVVYIKQQSGYGGDVCSSGTPEYVRFYLSFDNGATWQDQGMGSFTAYDVPGEKPLEYDVTLDIDPGKTFCFIENLPKVRAILSWNNPPPPNTPNFTPVWGNVVESRIQVDPGVLFLLAQAFEQAKLKVPPILEKAIDLAQPLPAPKPKALGVAELHALYSKAKAVPGHRFLFPEVQKLVATPALTGSFMLPGFKGALAELDVDLAGIIQALLNTNGDTTFEELDCVGLNPNQDAIVGVLRVKLSSGYSGNLCTAGSQEYVAFWVDWGDGAGLTYAGTASVNVHDIAGIPPEGLEYAVFLPVDLTCRRQPCEQGPKTARVRAILSWQVPPPPANPNFVPTWGNRQETLILIDPGPVCNLDDHTPYIESVGDMAVCDIDQATGLATGTGIIANFTAREAPFGSTITITGFILNPPNVLAGAAPFKYKVYVRQLPFGPWQPLSNAFSITITQQFGVGPPVQFPFTQSVDISGYYDYQEQIFPNAWRFVAGRVLAKWETAQPMTDLWEIKLEAQLPGPIFVPAGVIVCPDGTTRSTVNVYLDEVAPTAQVTITGFSRGGGAIQPAVDCGSFEVGDVIYGTYSTSDEHFNALTLHVEPVVPAHGATVNPSARAYPVVPTTGETGNWSLDTAGMDPCGYIVRLEVSDRTIVASGFIGWPNSDSTGFCLVAAP